MKNQSPTQPLIRKSLAAFFSLVISISAVFWLLGSLTNNITSNENGMGLPISSLMGISPIAAAFILTYREEGSAGVKRLLSRAFDKQGIKRKIWYLPVLVLTPAVMIAVNGIQGGFHLVFPNPQSLIMIVVVPGILFLIEAICEEVGWQGYAFEPMQERSNALIASLILGTGWAIWHWIPFIQMGHSTNWIVWQSLNLVATRILIVWIYNNTGKSLFAVILYHAMNNVSTLMLQEFGLTYDPMWVTITLGIIALIVTFLWGWRTLARFRFTRSGMWIQYPSSLH